MLRFLNKINHIDDSLILCWIFSDKFVRKKRIMRWVTDSENEIELIIIIKSGRVEVVIHTGREKDDIISSEREFSDIIESDITCTRKNEHKSVNSVKVVRVVPIIFRDTNSEFEKLVIIKYNL